MFQTASLDAIPARRRVTTGFSAALAVHGALLIAVLIAFRPHPVRIASGGGTTQVGIAPFNPGAVGTTGAVERPEPKVALAKKKAPAREAKTPSTAAQETAASAGDAGAAGQGAGSGSGPVRLGSGEGLTLLNKVTPVYPRVMEAAHMPGVVVLEAIIHRDGSIGDVKVLSSSNDAFAQAAIAAVKQWRYTPLPYEGLVTVTVNFTLPR